MNKDIVKDIKVKIDSLGQEGVKFFIHPQKMFSYDGYFERAFPVEKGVFAIPKLSIYPIWSLLYEQKQCYRWDFFKKLFHDEMELKAFLSGCVDNTDSCDYDKDEVCCAAGLEIRRFIVDLGIQHQGIG